MKVKLNKLQINAKIILKRIGYLRCERGSFLIEMLVAIALMGIVGVSLAGGLSSASKTLFTVDERQTAHSLAASQMEHVKTLSYKNVDVDNPANNYYDADTLPEEHINAGYTVVIQAIEIRDINGQLTRDINIQKILITVSHQGRPIIMETNDACTLAGYKVNQ